MADSLAGLGERKGEREYTGKFAKVGTKASGFASGGPYHCEDCIHALHAASKTGNAACYHPAVMGDPDLPDMPDGTAGSERKQDDGGIRVDAEVECCDFVRTLNDA